MDFYQKK